MEVEYPNEPETDCTTVLGHLVHKKCLAILQQKGLLSSIVSQQSNAMHIDVHSMENDQFKNVALNEDLICLKGLLEHPKVHMNNALFASKGLQNASKRSRVLVLEQDPDAIGMNLETSSKKVESFMSNYNKYQGKFCEKFAARRAVHRQHIFGGHNNKKTRKSTPKNSSSPPSSSSAASSSSSSMSSASSSVNALNNTTADAATTTTTTTTAAAATTQSSRLPPPSPSIPFNTKKYKLQTLSSSSIRSNSFFEKTRKFCSHLDIVSKHNCDWSKQLNELSKLPSWMYCQTKDDILHLLRKQIPGMTTPQMFIKVPGVWTAAHEENNQFRSVNVNHGPGPCEWAGVAAKHVPRLRQLVLETHSIDIYKEEGRWMPPLDYMIKHKIPVIAGIQEAGDAIMVGIGCVHWVYSRGKTCCSAWNIGDLSFDMFEAAFRRSDDNLEIGKENL